MEQQVYEPFGPEWVKEVKKLPKDFLIEQWKQSRLEIQKLKDASYSIDGQKEEWEQAANDYADLQYGDRRKLTNRHDIDDWDDCREHFYNGLIWKSQAVSAEKEAGLWKPEVTDILGEDEGGLV